MARTRSTPRPKPTRVATKQRGPTVPSEFAGLEPQQLDLLTLVALAGEAMTTSSWFAAAGRAGLVQPKPQVRGIDSLRAFGRATVARGVMVEQPQGYFRMPTRWAWALLERLQRAPDRRRVLYPATGSPQYHFDNPVRRKPETDLRLAILDADEAAVAEALDAIARFRRRDEFGATLAGLIGEAFIPARIALLPAGDRDACLWPLVDNATLHLRPISDAALHAAAAAHDKKLRLAAARLWVLRGQPEHALAIEGLPKYGPEGVALLVAFWSHNYGDAARIGTQAVAAMKGRKRKTLPDLEGVCHVLAGLSVCSDDPQQLHALGDTVRVQQGSRTLPAGVSDTLATLITALRDDAIEPRPRSSSVGRGTANELRESDAWEDEYRYGVHPQWTAHPGWLSPWVNTLHDRWLQLEPTAHLEDETTVAEQHATARERIADGLRAWADRAAQSGYQPVADELRATADAWTQQAHATPGLAAAFTKPSPWRAALAGLEAVVRQAAVARTQQATTTAVGPRVIWQLDLYRDTPIVQPRLRKTPRSRKGGSISLTRLLEDLPEYLTATDRRVLATAEPDPSGHRRRSMALPARAVTALVGHPHVIDDAGVELDIALGAPQLTTRDSPDGVTMTLEPKTLLEQEIVCRRVGNRVEVFERDATLGAIASVLGRSGELSVPTEGVDTLSQILSRLCLAGNVEVTGALAPQTQTTIADARPVLSMVWDGASLSIEATVAPLGLDGPHVRPGVGVEHLTAALRGGDGAPPAVVRCERDLADERRRLAAIEAACPTLASYGERPLYWHIASLPDALEIMLELQQLDETIIPAWPKGRALAPPKPRDLQDLQVKVATGRDWLGLTAELTVDDTTVLSYRAVMAARTGRRFIALGADRFIALSEQLRRRIERLAGLGPAHGEGIKASPTILAAADDLVTSLGAEFDNNACRRAERIRELEDQAPPRARRFRGKLRDYQRDGYAWLWRRTEAGLGACLADDMGLGKTIQALALLCTRSNRGPALVVCPTSVVVNWCREAERFAPSLRVSILADAPDRQAAVQAAKERDVVVCSYGILNSEVEALAAVEWGTVVFDEAHALKNARTQRNIAARRLRAHARIGLTGTPVENRVQELWSLYSVLVPGLLGPKAWFDGRFAEPMARGDREAAQTLRKLLQPFLLRRTKSEVLDELPPRTEVTIEVEPTAEEAAYYEALRQRANDRLIDSRTKRISAKDRAFLLAEIMKLRRAAVDPQLLDDPTAPAGAKLDTVVEHVAGLAERGHRTLVFTQFIGSLERLAARLEAAGLAVLTLQGSTSAHERARLVDIFQAGDADVFVLSLRAGGVGMNLTAADYVVHVDPWWNPAVEDQATDRSHRIGQSRPVTVVRFITEGTIEARIMELHEEKRRLADDLIGGLHSGGLDLDELRRLIGA